MAAVVPVAGVEEEAFLEESNHSSQVLCRECHFWVSFSLTSSERVGALEVLSAAKVPLQAAEGEYSPSLRNPLLEFGLYSSSCLHN